MFYDKKSKVQDCAHDNIRRKVKTPKVFFGNKHPITKLRIILCVPLKLNLKITHRKSNNTFSRLVLNSGVNFWLTSAAMVWCVVPSRISKAFWKSHSSDSHLWLVSSLTLMGIEVFRAIRDTKITNKTQFEKEMPLLFL